MCKSKKDTGIIQSSTPKSQASRRSNNRLSMATPSSFVDPSSSSSLSLSSLRFNSTTNDSGGTSKASKRSLSSLKDSLPENPHIYDFSEVLKATNNFLSKPFSSSSSSSSWRCEIRSKPVIIFQRKFHRRLIELPELQQRLSAVCRSHHTSLTKLLGAAHSGYHVYLVYEFVNGANLATCLRNPHNPNYTVLSTWLARMQIATDVAHGLEYIHHCSGMNSKFVHNRIKCSSILVAEGTFRAKICHFGTAELCGENDEVETLKAKTLTRVNSKTMRIEGTREYMSPEFKVTGTPSQKADVYAFGVVILELISGEEALRYVVESGGYKRISVIERAKEAVAGVGVGLRMWVDSRLRDSFPVDVAEKMVVLGLECVEEDPNKRPDMGRVAGRVSKLYLKSKKWADSIKMPTEISVSVAPR
ncbi:hypothetical protein K2173_020502 [Erythroxylum novogranatense]|uniref:Protein kinase domain-containing protein n=1 Tax=Erythroxylum novogranatense TaxID=1862640 RepID=A0AAV8TGH6_9ROSI|nr:hypothetical protein K2173_020502 [Erythroxylum novogranatense]